jgi:hypothetical protein
VNDERGAIIVTCNGCTSGMAFHDEALEFIAQLGATVRTLRSFIEAWHNFVAIVRDQMLPNPDVR